MTPEEVAAAFDVAEAAEDAAAVYFAFVAQEIEQWEKDPTKVVVTVPAEAPDGPPIGDDEDF